MLINADYEYHINGDIAQEFANYWVTSGDTEFFNTSLFPIYNSIATFYSEVVTKNGSQYVLTNMTDPDEYANGVDNGGFTMPLIADTLTNANTFRQLLGLPTNSTFSDIASNIFISRDAAAGIIDEYTGMNGSISVKQADVVLDTFPLNYQTNYTATDSLNDLKYYAGKQSLNGPGMTYAIFSIVAAAVAPTGCAAYTYQQYSEQPYARAPWFQFSEQLLDDFAANGGTHPAYPFLTGHGGANQVAIFGYLGLRLTPDYILHVDPTLPPQIPHLKYRTIYWHGWPISATANKTHTILTRLPHPLSTANATFFNTSIPVQIGSNTNTNTNTQNTTTPKTYALPPSTPLTLPNRNPASTPEIPHNLAQCHPITSPDPFLPGQFPLSANDGAPSTKWQPALALPASTLTITLPSPPFYPLSSLYFDWGQDPPVNFTVFLHNSSSFEDGTAVIATVQTAVEVSAPYNKTESSMVVPYMSNTTSVELGSGVWSGRFATLRVQGSRADGAENATGCTVAEWGVLGM